RTSRVRRPRPGGGSSARLRRAEPWPARHAGADRTARRTVRDRHGTGTRDDPSYSTACAGTGGGRDGGTGMRPIRVLLADDHALVRAGLRRLLRDMEGVEVVAEAADGRGALRLIEQ